MSAETSDAGMNEPLPGAVEENTAGVDRHSSVGSVRSQTREAEAAPKKEEKGRGRAILLRQLSNASSVDRRGSVNTVNENHERAKGRGSIPKLLRQLTNSSVTGSDGEPSKPWGKRRSIGLSRGNRNSLKRNSTSEHDSQFAKMLEQELNNKSAAEVRRMARMKYNRFVLSVNSKSRHYLDLLMTVCLITIAFWTPISIGFQITNTQMWSFAMIFSSGTDVFFILEMILHFRTSYISFDTREEITDIQMITLLYLKGWFWIDLLSCMPIGLAIYYVNQNYPNDYSKQLNIINALQVTRLIKCLRLYQLARSATFNKISGYISSKANPSMMRMLKLALIFLMTQHYIACAYWYVGSFEDEPTLWESTSFDQNGSVIEKYATALYWALLTTTANDVKPTTKIEKVFTCAMLVIGIGINSSIIGSAANLLANLDRSEVARKEQLDDITAYMRRRHVSSAVQNRILKYYEYLWSSGHSYGEVEDVFKRLPTRLKLELNMTLKRNFIDKVPLFKACSATGTVRIVQRLRSLIVMTGDLIIQAGELGEDFFFVNRGSVNVLLVIKTETSRNVIPLGTLGEGAFFGEIALLSENKIRTASVRAATFCELEILKDEDFQQTAQKFPQFHQIVSNIANSRMKTTVNLRKQDKLRASRKVPTVTKVTPFRRVSALLSPTSKIGEASFMRKKQATATPGVYDTILDSELLKNMSYFGTTHVAQRGSISGCYSARHSEGSEREADYQW